MARLTIARETNAKCYAGWRKDDRHEGVVCVFAATPGRAKVLAAGELDTEFCDVRIERCPDFDKYALWGSTPIQALLDAGWWCTYDWCGEPVDADNAVVETSMMGDEFCYHRECKEAEAKR